MFAFSQSRPAEDGKVDQVGIPFSTVLRRGAFPQGWNDTMFDSIRRGEEYRLERSGKVLSAKEANAKYAIGDLSFNGPEYENIARLLRDRKEAAMVRQYYLSQGVPGGLLSARGLGVFGAQMVAQFLNPLDLAMNFMPVVGSEKLAAQIARNSATAQMARNVAMGRLPGVIMVSKGELRQRIARGLVTEEVLAKSFGKAAPLVGTIVDAGIGNAIAEVPVHLANKVDRQQYSLNDSVANVVGGTIIGAGLHLTLKGLGNIHNRVSTAAKEVAFARAMENFVKGEPIRAESSIVLDEAAIRERVKFDEVSARDRAYSSLKDENIRGRVNWREKLLTQHPTLVHFTDVPPEKWNNESWKDESLAPNATYRLSEKGGLAVYLSTPNRQWTGRGKYMMEFSTAQVIDSLEVDPQDRTGQSFYLTRPFKTSDLAPEGSSTVVRQTGTQGLSPDEKTFFDYLTGSGKSEQEALSIITDKRIEKQDDEYFSREDVRAKMDDIRKTEADKLIEEERSKYDEQGAFNKARKAEIDRQIKEGKTLTDEQRKKWGYPDTDKTSTTVKDEVTELQRELEDEFKAIEEELDDATVEDQSIIDDITEALEKLKIEGPGKGTMEGVTGLPVWLWNGAVQAVIDALKLGKTITEAIKAGTAHIKKNLAEKGDGEQVISTAIRRHGEIFTGSAKNTAHFTISEELAQQHGIDTSTLEGADKAQELFGSFESGFLTNTGRFVDRDEASQIMGISFQQERMDSAFIDNQGKLYPTLIKQLMADIGPKFETRILSELRQEGGPLWRASTLNVVHKAKQNKMPFNQWKSYLKGKVPKEELAILDNLGFGPEVSVTKGELMEAFGNKNPYSLEVVDAGKKQQQLSEQQLDIRRDQAATAVFEDVTKTYVPAAIDVLDEVDWEYVRQHQNITREQVTANPKQYFILHSHRADIGEPFHVVGPDSDLIRLEEEVDDILEKWETALFERMIEPNYPNAAGQFPRAYPYENYPNLRVPGDIPGTYREQFITAPVNVPLDPVDKIVEEIRQHLLANAEYDFDVNPNFNALVDNGVKEIIDTGTTDVFSRSFDFYADNNKVEHEALVNKLKKAIKEKKAKKEQIGPIGWTEIEPDKNWQDGHFDYNHITNPIVRVRYAERILATGERVLFLEEVQPPQKHQTVPRMWQQNWREIAMKWALREAANKGLDGVAWTSGQIQAKRYALDTYVSELHWIYVTENNTVNLTGKTVAGNDFTRTVPYRELDQHIGLDAANKVWGDPLITLSKQEPKVDVLDNDWLNYLATLSFKELPAYLRDATENSDWEGFSAAERVSFLRYTFEHDISARKAIGKSSQDSVKEIFYDFKYEQLPQGLRDIITPYYEYTSGPTPAPNEPTSADIAKQNWNKMNEQGRNNFLRYAMHHAQMKYPELIPAYLQPPVYPAGTFTQDDMRVGGYGLRKLYDEDLRNIVNNLPPVKASGQQVKNVGLGENNIDLKYLESISDKDDTILDIMETNYGSIDDPAAALRRWHAMADVFKIEAVEEWVRLGGVDPNNTVPFIKLTKDIDVYTSFGQPVFGSQQVDVARQMMEQDLNDLKIGVEEDKKLVDITKDAGNCMRRK